MLDNNLNSLIALDISPSSVCRCFGLLLISCSRARSKTVHKNHKQSYAYIRYVTIAPHGSVPETILNRTWTTSSYFSWDGNPQIAPQQKRDTPVTLVLIKIKGWNLAGLIQSLYAITSHNLQFRNAFALSGNNDNIFNSKWDTLYIFVWNQN